ncbi:hypothetical protein FB45DRAFT_879131 [Roridomyces roridus]|uniref:Uncharacterized protein n=1 Tax=Roridomyces roridus TaxID=1738132 RepID=A0AAD7AZP2_9AGAR|nr:hypothetical protein FB45DRAFT_879131 [Roridomyces roridus]
MERGDVEVEQIYGHVSNISRVLKGNHIVPVYPLDTEIKNRAVVLSAQFSISLEIIASKMHWIGLSWKIYCIQALYIHPFYVIKLVAGCLPSGQEYPPAFSKSLTAQVKSSITPLIAHCAAFSAEKPGTSTSYQGTDLSTTKSNLPGAWLGAWAQSMNSCLLALYHGAWYLAYRLGCVGPTGVAKLEARRLLKRTGVRGDNVAAAIDAQRTLAILSELVTGLYKRTGIVGFAFFTRGNFSDITAPVAIHSGEALSFCAEMLNREPEVINAMLELWQIQRSSGAITAPSVEKMRVVGAAMIKSGLVQVTGKPNVAMNFENYVKSIVQGKHVTLVGWPAGVPWKRLAKQSNTGNVRRIYKALKDGTMKWKRLRTEEEEEEEERRFNKLINKGLVTVGKKRKVRDDLGATHQTQGRELESDAEDGAQGSGDDGDNDGEPSDNEDRPFVDYDRGYSDDNTARRKKAPAKSKSTKASATKTTKAAASKSTKAAASKSTAKTTPKSTAPKPKPPAKPSTKSKAALKPFVPTEAPPKYIFKNGKHAPNGAAVDEHARRMVEERGKHERQMRELKGGNESGSDEGSDDDDEGKEQVVSTKQGPPAKRRRTTKEPEEQAVKKRKKTVDKRAWDDSQDEDEQPVAKKAKLVVELPRPRPAWNSAPNATRGKRVGPPGVHHDGGSFGTTLSQHYLLLALAQSTSVVYSGKQVSEVSPAFADVRKVRDRIAERRKNQFPGGTDFHGVQEYIRTVERARPMSERYIHAAISKSDFNLVVTLHPQLAKFIHGVLALVIDYTFKRIEGDFDEWEVVGFLDLYKSRLPFSSFYCDQKTVPAFVQLFEEFFDVVYRVTGEKLRLRPWYPDANCRVSVMDGEVAQVQGFGEFLVKYNVPTISGIHETIGLNLVGFSPKTCTLHFQRYMTDIMPRRHIDELGTKHTVPADVLQRLKSIMAAGTVLQKFRLILIYGRDCQS